MSRTKNQDICSVRRDKNMGPSDWEARLLRSKSVTLMVFHKDCEEIYEMLDLDLKKINVENMN